MTWVTVAVVGGGATLAAGYMGAQAAKEAGATSAAGMRYAADTNREMFDITNRNLAPYREQGQTTLKELMTRMPELTKAYTAEDFAQGIDPGYQFRLAQGQKAAENQYNRGGGLVSGNTMQGMQDYIQGSAAQEFGSAFGRNTTSQTNIFNRLKGIADMGLSATGTTANAATSAGQTIGSAQIGAANAEAAGITGQAKAYGNTLQGMANYGTLPMYMGGAGGQQSPYSAFYVGGTGGGSAAGGGVGFNAGAGRNVGYMDGAQGLSLKL
jgi:hypothetical protein